MHKNISISGIGDVSLQKSAKAKHIRIRIHPEKGVILTVPANASEQHAINFIIEKKEWVRKALLKQESKKAELFEDCSGFSVGKKHKLHIAKHSKATLKTNISKGDICIWYPDTAQVNNPKIQQFIRKCIAEAMRIEAKLYLPSRVEYLAQKHGFKYNSVAVKNASTRWGSCSSRGNINLNVHLMQLPDELIDYVIIHELVHTKVRNHATEFWNAVERVLPNSKKIDKKLNDYSSLLSK